MAQQQQKKKEGFINFKNLNNEELNNLSKRWENDARIFEIKLEKYISNGNPNQEKLERLWGVGNSLWSRLRKLETYRTNRGLK